MKEKLKVFEAFAGIGAQTTALKRLGIDHEVVGISEWFVDAVICYDALHCQHLPEIPLPSYEEQISYLEQFEFSRDSVNPCEKITALSKKETEDLYKANKRTKNLGSITQITGAMMPECDILVYSFPCQDLSTGGNAKGMKKGSSTRSGMLWELEKILEQLKELKKLPEYLILENVTTICSPTHRGDLEEWLEFLTRLGYHHDECMKLNAMDFNVPQNRVRAFIVSRLHKPTSISKKIKVQQPTYTIVDFIKSNYDQKTYREEADMAQLNRTPSREVMWKKNGMDINEETVLRTITCNMDRTHTAGLFLYHGPKGDTYRRLTIREAFLLMGFTEEEYEKTVKLGYSYRKMNKLIGNSIVVNVLEEIFRCIIVERKMKKK